VLSPRGFPYASAGCLEEQCTEGALWTHHCFSRPQIQPVQSHDNSGREGRQRKCANYCAAEPHITIVRHIRICNCAMPTPATCVRVRVHNNEQDPLSSLEPLNSVPLPDRGQPAGEVWTSQTCYQHLTNLRTRRDRRPPIECAVSFGFSVAFRMLHQVSCQPPTCKRAGPRAKEEGGDDCRGRRTMRLVLLVSCLLLLIYSSSSSWLLPL
jgi:hypothetical protein